MTVTRNPACRSVKPSFATARTRSSNVTTEAPLQGADPRHVRCVLSSEALPIEPRKLDSE